MKLDTFINLNRSTAITIPMSKIALTSNTHVEVEIYSKSDTQYIDLFINIIFMNLPLDKRSNK